ncbi:MAG: DUF3833 family protein [bacterium]
MLKKSALVLLVFTVLVTAGCAGRDVGPRPAGPSRLQPENFFDGRVTGWGFSETRFGGVDRWFQVDFRGRTEGDTSIWHETLRFSDGEVEERTWRVVSVGERRYDVDATGMVGTGSGLSHGNAVQWNYYLKRSYGCCEWTFWVDDWMYKTDDNTLIVRANFSWFGMTVGQGYMFLRKVE